MRLRALNLEHAWWRLWWLLFLYPAAVALLVQLVLLPYVFPQWHAGDGLLLNGDWVGFQQHAVDYAQAIRREGWGVWQLRAAGQAPAGIASAIYALTGIFKPWQLIPIYAALQATATLVLLRIVQLFVPSLRQSFWSIVPLVFFPSAMMLYTQLHKDAFFVAGNLLYLHGWLLLVRRDTWGAGLRRPLQAVFGTLAGVALVWVVRPYGVQMMQGFTAVLFVPTLLVSGVLRYLQGVWSWRRVAAAAVVGLALVAVTVTVTQAGGLHMEAPTEAEGMAAGEGPMVGLESIPWQPTGWLPQVMENKLYTLALIRNRYLLMYPGAGSKLDINTQFHSATEMLIYSPRALQIAYLAPFPNQWFAEGRLAESTLTRRIVAVEMAAAYMVLPFLLYAVWCWRARLEFWLLLGFCTGMMLVDTYATPNAGTLYRGRYGFWLTILSLGIAGFTAWCRDKRQDQAEPGADGSQHRSEAGI